MGDGVLAYFGYPQAYADDAERAVRAGLALIETVGKLRMEETDQARIGVASAWSWWAISSAPGELRNAGSWVKPRTLRRACRAIAVGRGQSRAASRCCTRAARLFTLNLRLDYVWCSDVVHSLNLRDRCTNVLKGTRIAMFVKFLDDLVKSRAFASKLCRIARWELTKELCAPHLAGD